MSVSDHDDPVVRALLELGGGDLDAAASSLDRAGDDRLARAIRRGLEHTEQGVYVEPEAFTRFIDGGANPALYDATIEALRNVWSPPGTVLDIGCGDGRVSAAVAANGMVLDLLEPSEGLLPIAERTVVDAGGVVGDRHATDLTSFVRSLEPTDRWDGAQATFALHNLPTAARRAALAELCPHVGRLALVEFDVPAFADRSVEHAEYCARAYQRGVEQHPDPVVIDGFLVPVLLGQFLPGAERHTHEQPVETWADDLRASGFTEVSVTPVYDGFWWGPAALVSGVGGA